MVGAPTNRIELHVELEDVADLRKDVLARGFELHQMKSVPRTDQHDPPSREPWYEERYHHPDGNIVRLFPHAQITMGPHEGVELGILVEYRHELELELEEKKPKKKTTKKRGK